MVAQRFLSTSMKPYPWGFLLPYGNPSLEFTVLSIARVKLPLQGRNNV